MVAEAVRRAAHPLRTRSFRYFFLAQGVSNVGDTFTYIALPFAVLGLTRSVADVGYVLSARVVPMVVFLLAGGVWADRVPRRSTLIIGANAARCSIQACMATLLLIGSARVWELIVLMGMYGVCSAIFYPSMSGLVPQMVRNDELQRANALLSFTNSSSSVVGPALAGLLVALAGPGWAIGVDALSFGISAALVAAAHMPGTVEVASDQGMLSQLRGGWQEVKRRNWVWVCIIEFAVFQFAGLGSVYVLGPVTAARYLGGASVWGIILAVAGAGSLLGDVAALRLEPSRLLVAVSASILMCVPALILLGVVAPAGWIAIAFLAYGVGLSFADTMWFTALQQHIPAQSLSRVSAYDWMGSAALRPLGQILAGPLTLLIGLRSTLLGAAMVITLTSILALRSRSVRGLRRLTERA